MPGPTTHPRSTNLWFRMALGVRTGDEAQAERIKARCLKAGLIVAAEGEVVALFPSLVIDEPTAVEGLNILERCAAA